MISEKEFDKEAAMLAAFTGGQLNTIDKMMDSSSGHLQANRLDVNSFIDTYKTGSRIRANRSDPANRGYVSEDVVQSMVPDNSTLSRAENVEIHITQQAQNVSNPIVSAPVSANSPVVITSKMEEDIASIKNLMERINANLTKMSGMMGKVFCSLTEKENFNK